MAIFDYKGSDARADVAEAFRLARYSQIEAFGALGDALGIVTRSGDDLGIPAGWRELTAAELGVSAAKVDADGFFTGATSPAAQTKVLGFVGANGQIERVSIAFAGTNNLNDLPDYLALAEGRYIEEFRYLLDAAAAYSAGKGLAGGDVVVSGYSLGGAAVNIFAERAGEIAGGFYATSDFFGFSSPTIFDDETVFNYGAENDVVYRVIGDSDGSVSEGLLEALINEDNEFLSSADNIVFFNDLYASPLSPYGPFGILNLFGGWNAHITGIFEETAETIGRSSFYDLIERDSAVVISQLSEGLRGTVWVEDAFRTTSSHFGDPAFLLGTDSGDRLRDGEEGNYLDGFAGNDRFDLSTGNDSVAGGTGTDTVLLDGRASQYEAIRLSDGTVYLDGAAGGYGLKELVSVESVAFGLASYTVRSSALDSTLFLSPDIRYASHREGGEGGDRLTGGSGVDRLFGRDGNDQLFGGSGNDLVHGGAGDDRLFGQAGNDRLFGAAGDDVLVDGLGNDRLSGGAGDDRFDFSSGFGGRDVVTDFDAGAEGDDMLILAAQLFRTADAALARFQQTGFDALLSWSGGSVVLEDVTIADLGVDDILLA
ncbi:MAG: calcium-binding protein [Rhizobiaceae bacterium]|nr:calcium-binding protein [Rhizobiaceae bacterium]